MRRANATAHRNDKGRDVAHKHEKSMLTTSRKWFINNLIKAVKSVAPATGVALVGLTVSLLPLGPFTPMFSILVTSFASCQLKQNVVGGAVALLHAGGIQGFEGHILALLSFMSLNSTLSSHIS
jgi:hypothetical protein